MPDGQGAVEDCLREVERARNRVLRMRARQISKDADRDYLKSVAYSWFKTHRPIANHFVGHDHLGNVDTAFRSILEATARSSAKATYLAELKNAISQLSSLRTVLLTPKASAVSTPDSAPDFSALVSDPLMKGILERRWTECQQCLHAGASLAATVMMGGLLEALFVARANIMPNKSPLFRAQATPIDHKTKKPLTLTEWTLRPYIDVGAELRWITQPGKDVASVLRDYRNYVHPEKERSHGVNLNNADAAMFWEITKGLARQLLSSVTNPLP